MSRDSVQASVERHRRTHGGKEKNGGIRVISIPGGDRMDMLRAFRELSDRTDYQLRRRVVDSRSAVIEAAVNRPGIVSSLSENGFVILDNVEDPKLLNLARSGAESLRDRGLMRPVMSQRGQGRDDEILVVDSLQGEGGRLTIGPARHEPDLSQEAYDLLGSNGCTALASLASSLKGLPSALMKARDTITHTNESKSLSWIPDLGVSESFMLSSYPGQDAHYLRHRDNDVVPQAMDGASWSAPAVEERVGESWEGPPGSRVGDRAVTAILYLNSNWREEDGGCLQIYPVGQPSFEVQPEMGRLVIFDSRRMEHEVLPTRRQRFALSAWIPALEMFESLN